MISLIDLQGGHSDGAEKDYWIPFLSVPLKLATVSPYAHSTAMLRYYHICIYTYDTGPDHFTKPTILL